MCANMFRRAAANIAARQGAQKSPPWRPQATANTPTATPVATASTVGPAGPMWKPPVATATGAGVSVANAGNTDPNAGRRKARQFFNLGSNGLGGI